MSDQATLGEFTSTTDTDESDTNSGERLYRDEEWLREQYWGEWHSTSDIASDADVTRQTISSWMKRLGIERRSAAETKLGESSEPLKNSDWLREQYWNRGRTIPDIADKLDVSPNTVLSRMDAYGIERRTRNEAQTDGELAPLTDPDWLRKQYVEQERSAGDIADELGLSPNTVRRRLRNHDIQIRSPREARAEGNMTPLRDGDWLREQYCDEGRSSYDIASELDVAGETVLSAMKRHGIDRRSTSETRVGDSIELLEDEEWLREQYWERGLALAEIGNILDVHGTTVRRWMKGHGVETRDRDTEIERPDHLDHPVRSDWELAVANLLTDHDIQYQYEPMSIGYGEGRTYTPDFVTDDYIIEVKGRIFDGGSEKQKARAAMDALHEREYVVVGTVLPADHHFSWDERDAITALFD